MWTRACSNKVDPITMDEWKEIADSEDVVSILPENGAVGQGGFCIRRKDLVTAMTSTIVWRWLPNDPSNPKYGQPDKNVPYFKLPQGEFVTQSSLVALKKGFSLFQLESVGKQLVGTAHGVSQLHGDLVMIYRLQPILTRKEFVAELNKRSSQQSPKANHKTEKKRSRSRSLERKRSNSDVKRDPSIHPSAAVRPTIHPSAAVDIRQLSRVILPRPLPLPRIPPAISFPSRTPASRMPVGHRKISRRHPPTEEECALFATNPKINPRTQRSIIHGGPIYRKFVANCPQIVAKTLGIRR
jgi:hypothetical protein